MRKLIFILTVCLSSTAIFYGCKKDATMTNANGQVVVPGSITLKIQAKHHYWGVPYLHVYLKKNATEWPGRDSTKYEFNTVADNEGNCEFDHLFPGNYYIYASGFDVIFGMNVMGYGPVQLNSTTAPNNEFDFTLLVSE